MSNLAPIILFCYNRPDHVQKTVEALMNNTLASSSDLFIFSDGSKGKIDKKDVNKVRNYIHTISGFKNITIREGLNNKGLAKSVIEGVTEIINEYGKVIVVEDDIVTSSHFLTYMNTSLEKYKKLSKIFSISGYIPPGNIPDVVYENVFLYPRISSWGWGTWIDRWSTVDWEINNICSFFRNKKETQRFNRGGMDLTPMLLNQIKGQINSWAIRFSFACFLQNKYCLFPKYSLVKNIGADGSGTHLKKSNIFNIAVYEDKILFPDKPKENNIAGEIIRLFYKQSYIRRIMNFIKLKYFLLRKS